MRKPSPGKRDWSPETDPVLARIHASCPQGTEWDEFMRVIEDVRRQSHAVAPTPLNDLQNSPVLTDAAGAFADDAGWDSFQNAIQQYRDEQTRAELARTRRKK